MIKFFKKYHKWLSIIFTLFILLFALSGIVLNHRGLFSSYDVSRSLLPSEYQYYNWNKAAVKSTEKIGEDSLLIYGNIGVYLTNPSTSYFENFNQGFPKGVDNHKIEKILKCPDGNIYAATLFGLFKYDFKINAWSKIFQPDHNPRVVDLVYYNDNLFVLSRSFLYKLSGDDFIKIDIKSPTNYDNKIGLFKTLWVIHSGEIYGNIGKLIVDIFALIFIFLTISGLIYFILRLFVRSKKGKHHRDKKRRIKVFNKWNIKWHNKIGWITIVFLIITTLTGMFLRPPLLAAIAYTKVDKIPFTELDTPNPWFDKLRRILIDEENQSVYIATPDGVYISDINFEYNPKFIPSQPPISVMGVNVFKQIDESRFLIGSFEGLFVWNIKNGRVYDAIKLQNFRPDPNKRIPLGDYLVTGYSEDFNSGRVFFDFNFGAAYIGSNQEFVKMPLPIKNQKMSLWNVALEIHTARMYGFMFGKYYILFIPLAGIVILFILISGFIVWYKRFRR